MAHAGWSTARGSRTSATASSLASPRWASLGFAAPRAKTFFVNGGVPYRDVLERVVLPVVATFLTRGAGASRLLVAGGVFWCAAAAHAKAKEIATRALQKFGERVLEPTEAELRH